MSPNVHHVMVAYMWVGGATGLLVAFLGIVAAITRGSTKRSNSIHQHQLLARLREEIEGVKQENALIRSEHQRPLSLGQAAGAIRGQLQVAADSSGEEDGGDEGDEAWAVMTDATVLQATIVSACQDLQTAIRHVQTQLTTGIPVSELDRRATDGAPRLRPDISRPVLPPEVKVIRAGRAVRSPAPASGHDDTRN
jgi:hypothetical protein